MTLEIRSATPEDGESLAAILGGFVDETPWLPRVHSSEENRGFGAFLIENSDVIVAQDDVVVGFLATCDAMIDALYIHPDHRGRGIGTLLLDTVKAKVDWLELWVFQANTAARKFYASHGFVEGEMTDGQTNDEKIPDVFMSWGRKES